MKAFLILALSVSSYAALADVLSITCGDKDSRVNVEASQVDPLSDAKVSSVVVDGQSTNFRKAVVDGLKFDIIGFGYKGYESIHIELTSCTNGKSVVGSAKYNKYHANSPMNPMYNIDLKCTCESR